MTAVELAKIAYDAYVESAGGVSLVTGDKLPEFDKLPEKIQAAWWAAAYAVREALRNPLR